MKQNIILWTAAFIITFLSGFLESLTSPYYPVSGTIGIAEKKVSYKFDRIHHGKEPYEFIIRTDLDDLKGRLEYRNEGKKNNWNMIPLKSSGKIIHGKLPALKTGSAVEYRAALFYEGRTHFIPSQKPVTMKFYGRISPFVNSLYFFTLFLGLLLSTRSGLDYFNENEKIKKLSLLAIVVFFINAFIAAPIRNTYELGALGHEVPPVTRIFPTGNIILFLIWMVTVILMFNSREYKKIAVISAIIILLAFQILLP